MSRPANAIILLLDRSGSMGAIRDETIASLNAYLDEMRDRPAPGLTLTLTRFDSQAFETVFQDMPIAAVPRLASKDLVPRGSTPLIDALAGAINTARAQYSDRDRVIIVTMTDGRENASREFKLADLRALIAQCASWDFVFLGASIDAYADAGRFGIDPGATMSYRARDIKSSVAAYAAVAGRAKRFMATGEKREFSRSEKKAAGDEYDPST